MTIDESQIHSEAQRRAYETIVLKKPVQKTYGSSDILTAEEKMEYPAVMDEMRNTVPGMKKLMADYGYLPHADMEVLLQYRTLKTLQAVLMKLEEISAFSVCNHE